MHTSYLSAGIVLSPVATSGNPLKSRNWLNVEYIGVPPGRNARLAISVSANGHERFLSTEGWPHSNRTGRKISAQRLKIISRGQAIQVWENGKQVYESNERILPFDAAFLYLQVSGHSNYPAREIYFDNIQIVENP